MRNRNFFFYALRITYYEESFMSIELAVHTIREALQIVLLLSAPILLASLSIGFLVSLFQAVTQKHEMMLTAIPKIISVIADLIIFLPWMLNIIITFTSNLIINIPNYIQGL